MSSFLFAIIAESGHTNIMQKEISLHHQKVTYMLRKSLRARRMRLSVNCDGAVMVTTPYYFHDSLIERFITEKSRWLLSKIAFFQKFSGQIIVQHGLNDYYANKAKAYQLAVGRISHFNETYQYAFNRIGIRNQRTRWGSCSRKGNLNFNYKIIFLPVRLADYIIVHELCHVQEFNHSRKFWDLVSRVFPDHQDIRRELRRIRIGIT